MYRLSSFRTFLGGLAIACPLALGSSGLHASELAKVRASPLPTPADGRLNSLIATHPGQPVLVNFWASWCEPCREEMPSLQRLAERSRRHGLVVITVAVADRLAQVERFLSDNAIQLPVVDDRDQVISRAWGARVLPGTVVLDRHHRIRLRGKGAIDWDSPANGRHLHPLLKPPA